MKKDSTRCKVFSGTPFGDTTLRFATPREIPKGRYAVPQGRCAVRTRVLSLKGLSLGPLDDGGLLYLVFIAQRKYRR